jgi:hypothetical protein
MKDRYKGLKDNVKDWLSRGYDHHVSTTRKVNWAIQRFFYYSKRAVLNGYPVRIRKGIHITLKMEPVRELDIYEEGRYFKSNRKFGYMFYLEISGHPIFDRYNFYPEPELAEMIQEIIDSDKIYQLT